jgi:hypothetical protein
MDLAEMYALFGETAASSFTVLVKNAALGTSKYVGTFGTQEEAEGYATKEISRSRKFASFEVWTGTPKKPGRFVKDLGSGSQ